jgi:hypothetical protein
MSFEEFQEYYETRHSKLVILIPRVYQYFRRYLKPLIDHPMNTDSEGFDVITELWFKSQDDFDVAMARNMQPHIIQVFADDELNLFDRSKTRMNVVDERFSDLTVDLSAIG